MFGNSVQQRIFGVVAVLIVARLAIYLLGSFLSDTQEEMINNQEALSEHIHGFAKADDAERMREYTERKCETLITSKACSAPHDFSEVGECLLSLARKECGSLPEIHLCAAVEELELCSDPFEDQSKNGCDRLRKYARCRQNPAPDDREGLWMIRLDDGLWDGVE